MTGDNDNPLLDELVRFVLEGHVLRDRQEERPADIRVEGNLEIAKDLAWRQSEADFLPWADLKQQQMSVVRGVSYRPEFAGVRTAMDERFEQFLDTLSETLPRPYENLVDDAAGDLFACCLSRAVMGTQNTFFEKLAAAYLSGGWPCGWSGSYPQGNLVVFYPTE